MTTRLAFLRVIAATLFLTVLPTARGSTTWYVNGVTGSDSNDCMSPTTACKTIGHAISLASAGDSIIVAAATYSENLTIPFGLSIHGAGALTTIIDGGGIGPVVTTTSGNVNLSGLTITNGTVPPGGTCSGLGGGGICAPTAVDLTILNCIIIDNGLSGGSGGGIYIEGGSLTINKSTITYNAATQAGGVFSKGVLQINNSTISGNLAVAGVGGGLIWKGSDAYISNSTISGNAAAWGGGIYNDGGGRLFINDTTIAGNDVNAGRSTGAGIYGACCSTFITMQNSIVANNLGSGNCGGTATFTSNGYNLSSDDSCHLTGPGDLNNTDPKLGLLRSNGGPTETMSLGKGSPAIDTGNPAGCTDGVGHLLKTDQRGAPRPDKDDTSGCDIGAYEIQN